MSNSKQDNYKAKITINEDLRREREQCTFNTDELTYLFDGGKEKTLERRELVEFFAKDPRIQDEVPIEYLSYKERYQEAVKKSCIIFEKLNEWEQKKNTGSSVDLFNSILGGLLGSAILKDGMPLTLHYVMFIPTLMGQGTIEQQTYWIGRAWNCSMLGTYAQTELGHGTFIRGLETTAHYDPDAEEFELHSPTLTSYKWWPGGLGHTANYAVVVAQLHSKGECHGIHPFIVQLRDEETHHPMPGIIIGEIGAKLGMNGTNNGYLGFDHVRIPRENMLMKNAKVLKDGTYVKSPSEKLTYGTMIFVRVAIVRSVAASYLAKAVTIATRYSAVRRQSELKPGEREPQIMDYKTQQFKLFPHIAEVWAMVFSSRWLWDMYNNVTSELDQGDLERLPELHAMACCLKAVSSSDAVRGIEECRKACGGHGYMISSSLPVTYGLATAAETYEGENTVLYLQTARYLMKAWNQAKAGGSMTKTTEYLSKQPFRSRVPWRNTMDNVIEAYENVAAGHIRECSNNIDRSIRNGAEPEIAWNENSNLLVQCAEFHCRAFMVRTFLSTVHDTDCTFGAKSVLTQLCELYAVCYLLKNLGYFLMYSSVSIKDVASIQNWQESLLSEIKVNAVGLVDSFDISDEILSSALGAYDGNVYQRLFDEANKSPLNAQPVDESFNKYLKPFFKANM